MPARSQELVLTDMQGTCAHHRTLCLVSGKPQRSSPPCTPETPWACSGHAAVPSVSAMVEPRAGEEGSTQSGGRKVSTRAKARVARSSSAASAPILDGLRFSTAWGSSCKECATEVHTGKSACGRLRGGCASRRSLGGGRQLSVPTVVRELEDLFCSETCVTSEQHSHPRGSGRYGEGNLCDWEALSSPNTVGIQTRRALKMP